MIVAYVCSKSLRIHPASQFGVAGRAKCGQRILAHIKKKHMWQYIHMNIYIHIYIIIYIYIFIYIYISVNRHVYREKIYNHV